MTPFRILIVAGLLGLGAGCSTLQQGSMFRPISERVTPPAVKPADEATDIFKPETESPIARMSHYFPTLPKIEPSAPTNSSAGWFRRGSRTTDEHLRAVPRPDTRLDDRTETAAAPRNRAGRPIYQPRPIASPDPSRERDDRITPASRVESETIPVLPTSINAETDPDDEAPKPRALPPLTESEQALRAARIAQASRGSISFRRTPEGARARATPLESQPIEPAVAARKPAEEKPAKPSGDEDREMKLVKAQVEETPAQDGVAVAQDTAEAKRSLDPPADAEPRMVEEPKPPIEKEVAEADKAERLVDDPPPISLPQAEAPPVRTPRQVADRNDDQPQNSASLRAAELTARPRMSRFAPTRTDRVADLPAPRFPDTYYQNDPTSANPGQNAKVDTETRQARWIWTPKLFRRLRGDSIAAENKANLTR